jgi:hypothetical protein
MPGLISNHSHVGLVDGVSIKPENYNRQNILRQLRQYEAYGSHRLQPSDSMAAYFTSYAKSNMQPKIRVPICLEFFVVLVLR